LKPSQGILTAVIVEVKESADGMPQIFIYEFTTGGGPLAIDEASSAALLAEGRAMVAAIASDFAMIDGMRVTCLVDQASRAMIPGRVDAFVVHDHPGALAAFDRLAAQADWTVVIAPEIDGHLLKRCRRVMDRGGRLLGPAPSIVELAGDKQATAEHLATAGVRTTEGVACPAGPPWPRDFSYPAIWKPCDGAGSIGVCYVANADSRVTPFETCVGPSVASPRGRLERFCPGMPASVAVLCGPAGITALAPCRQLLSNDGRFHYLGGSLPLDAPHADRAARLAIEAAASLPQPLGYLGVDLVLGPRDDGSADRVIEINPRLTTSYVGLRAACENNLAEAMLAIAQGKMPSLSYRPEPICFTAEGKVELGEDEVGDQVSLFRTS
jgi:predicted ATP-grasp superfamily ATP-dependent carboligase